MKKIQKNIDIFIIDDDYELLNQCHEKNKQFNYNMETQSNFSEALSIITAPEFFAKVILFDLESEKESLKGFDLISEFRKSNPDSLSILGILTDKDELKDRKEALKYSINLFFQKPLDFDLVFSQIQPLLLQEAKKRFHILLLDGKDTFYKQLQDSSKKSPFEFHYLADPKKLFEEIRHYYPDLFILGNTSFSQIEMLEMIRSDFRFRFLPIFFLLNKEDISIIKSVIKLDIQGFFETFSDVDKFLQQLIVFFKKQEISKFFHLKAPFSHFYQKDAIVYFFDAIITLKNTIFTFTYLQQIDYQKIAEDIRQRNWQKFCSFLSS